ncbi:MAG: glycosyltransferase, partial [Bacteroidales bacterium]|nr:glycosyltransferase [Bacteroidales bacterium]
DVVLDGCERLRQRPVGQLVDALRLCGAQIEYMGEQGYPPVHIAGRKLAVQTVTIPRPLSPQFISALLLIGVSIQTDITSPYIEMTQHLITHYNRALCIVNRQLEKDWSAAAFWYEYVALHGGEMLLKGLQKDSLQGDKVVAALFRPLGVQTDYNADGVRIYHAERVGDTLTVDFSACPDLYPAIAITCDCLHISLQALGTEALAIKESNRLLAVKERRTYHDHRIAMALLAADLPCDDTDCITKSYPAFIEQLCIVHCQSLTDTVHCALSTVNRIIPRRGINDDNKGKKYALHKLISAATAEYVWLMDDDITPAPASQSPILHSLIGDADLYILPIQMVGGDSLLERLQIAEYAAIQEVTMRTAKRGKAVMCSGANLIVRRERWLESYPDLHVDIPSGDDMFLLESFRRRNLRIACIDDPAYTATVSAIPSWSAFWRQRMRWAGKAPHYRDRIIVRYGVGVLLANILQLLCPVVILIKFPIEYRLIKKRDPEVSFFIALLLEIIYPLYMLLCILGGLCRKGW